ncbi:MAG: hypothetical protein HQ596_02815 [Candidatus Saganbacteria bacterium]|nr:hypothetical protein [Candidatus Saganbacteria bacterium]
MGIPPLNNSTVNRQLSDSWAFYANNMIEEDGRPLADSDNNDLDLDGDRSENITFSESSAYVLMRAAYMDDEENFNLVWNWTQANLQRNKIPLWVPDENSGLKDIKWVKEEMPPELNDHLFAWRYVPSLGGIDRATGNETPGGVISLEVLSGDDHSGFYAASDDIEIAVALFMAHLRGWGPKEGETYLEESRLIIQDAWNKYVGQVGEGYYFFAGDQFAWSGEINPSYFRQAYFSRIFPYIDPEHPWHEVSDSSYDVMKQTASMPINGRSREGVNLPPNWIAMSYKGELVDSKTFSGVAGEVFGWDAFRALYGPAQDYAWYENQNAETYLTDPAVGPIDFLSRQVSGNGRLPGGFRHDGTSVPFVPEVVQTHGLANEQLAMYGGYLPFFYYAGKTNKAQSIITRLTSRYDSKGYWGSDPNNYYSQNWVWFGLILVNGHPKANDLIGQLKNIRTPQWEQEKMEEKVSAPLLYQVDYRIGGRDSDNRPVLNSELARDNLNLKQMRETIFALASEGYFPLSGDVTHVQEINAIDQNYDAKLLAYFADPQNYWNNVVALLIAYSQKAIKESRREDLDGILSLFDTFRSDIEVNEHFSPYTYNRTRMDVAEIEIRAQFIDRPKAFYEESIRLAMDTIECVLDCEGKKAAPDYYIVLNLILLIGDLHLRIYSRSQNDQDLARASEYYNQVGNLSTTGINIYDQEYGFSLGFTLAQVDNAISFNQKKGHLSQEQTDEIYNSVLYLQAVGSVKDASLAMQSLERRGIDNMLREVERCNLAISDLKELATEQDDFYVYYARTVKADLLLALSDSVKYYLWPFSSAILSSDEMAQIQESLDSLSDEQIKSALNKLIANSQDMTKSVDEKIESLFVFNDLVLEDASELYQETPSDLGYLYAWSQIKLLEVGIRKGTFMDREFFYLLPFYTQPALTESDHVPDQEFLGVQENYLKGLMLISQATKVSASLDLQEQVVHKESLAEAKGLLQTALKHADKLKEPFRTYFIAHIQLKFAEISVRRGNYSDAISIFYKVEDKIAYLETQETEMLWRTHSLKAELYHEWAAALSILGRSGEAGDKAEKALEMCYLSDSAYDFEMRRLLLTLQFTIDEEPWADAYGRTQ